MRLLAIEQTRSPQGKLRLRFDSGEAMLVLPAVVADLSLRPGMDIPDAARASLEAAPAPRPQRSAPCAFCPPQRSPAPSWSTVCARRANRPRTPGRPSNGSTGSPCSMTRPQPADRPQRHGKGLRRGTHPADALRQAHPARAVGRGSWPSSRSRTTRSDAFTEAVPGGGSPTGTEIRRAADALLRRGHAWGDIRRALERYDPDLPEE